jgi:hypothetical protein
MKWENIRENYPNQWILFEAINAYSDNGKRIVDEISVLNSFEESKAALFKYRELHTKNPNRELYVAHTIKEQLDIIERKWLGIRR